MIEINNLTPTPIDKGLLKKTAGVVLKGEKRENKHLSIDLVRASRMKELNKRYLKRGYSTDVLAFPEIGDFYSEKTIGEVVICPQTVRDNAKRYDRSYKEELSRALIHGILHLLGYDHEKSIKESKRMKHKEDYYLEKIF